MKTPDPKPRPPGELQSREARLAKALRENLRRRKAPQPAPAPSEKSGD